VESAPYLVKAVVFEGRSVREVAAQHGISKTWLYELVARFRADEDEGLVPRSRRPRSSPNRISAAIEDEIVALRKFLGEEGFDDGAVTIQSHLLRHHQVAPAVSSIWRVLHRRGFVVPQPEKRPKSADGHFEAALPNELWQMDVTHVPMARGREAEVLNVLDDHSRLCPASRAFWVAGSPDVVATFADAGQEYGLPARVLSDNGAIFTAAYRNGRCLTEIVLGAHGIEFSHSRPYHPQTCGKVCEHDWPTQHRSA
jgi:transposase InsO family protein